MKITETGKERVALTRLVLIYMLVFLAYRFLINTTPSHFLKPSFFLLELDLTYWFYKFSFIPGLIIYNQTGAVVFDMALFLFCGLGILFPLRRVFILLFSCLYFIYAISYDTYIVHHANPLSVMVLITLPFWAKKNEHWKLLWEAMRYYICFLYTSAFIWKTIIGNSFFVWDNGVNSVKYNLVEYLYHCPDTITALVLKYFITHPFILNTGHVCIILLEGLMVVGFFTKKYDTCLMIFPVIIHLATYFFADVFFIEMLVLVFVFFNKKQITWLLKKFPLLGWYWNNNEVTLKRASPGTN